MFRGVKHRMVVFMNLDDIQKDGLSVGQQVYVKSKIGSMKVQLVAGPIRKGNAAMYFPEANEIVPPEVDPQSKTPSFKKSRVKIQRI